MQTISRNLALKEIESNKQGFAIEFCLPKTGEMVNLKRAISWKHVQGKFFHISNANGDVIKINQNPKKEKKNKYLRLLIDLETSKTYNIYIDLITGFNDKEVFL